MAVICCQPECCIICRDNFDRADSSDITAGATCDWTVSGSPSIEGQKLKLPSGSYVTGPDCDQVRLRVWSGSPGAVAKIHVGSTVATITLGLDEAHPGHVVLTTDADSAAGDYARIVYDDPEVVTLCVGRVGVRGGAEFRDDDPRNGISAETADHDPATPYGQVKLEAYSGTIYCDGVVLSYTKSATRPQCSKCNVRECEVCFDGAFDPLSGTECKLTAISGDWSPNPFGVGTYTEDASAILKADVGNPDNRSMMVAFVQWEWQAVSDQTDPVRVYVAYSDPANNHFLEYHRAKDDEPDCIKLCRQVGGAIEVLSVVPNGFGPTYSASIELVFNEETGQFWYTGSSDWQLASNVEFSGAGRYVAFGTGNSPAWGTGAKVNLSSFAIYWPAGAGRSDCPHLLPGCMIWSGAVSGGSVMPDCSAVALSGTWEYDPSTGCGSIKGSTANSWLQISTAHPARYPTGSCDFASCNTAVGSVTRIGWGLDNGAPSDYLEITIVGEAEITYPVGAVIGYTVQYDLVIGGSVVASETRVRAAPSCTLCIGEGVIRVTIARGCVGAMPETIIRYGHGYTAGGPYWGIGIGSLGGHSSINFSFQLSHSYETTPDDPFDAYPPGTYVCEPCDRPRIGATCLAPRAIKVILSGIANDLGVDPTCNCDQLNGIYYLPPSEFFSHHLYALEFATGATHCCVIDDPGGGFYGMRWMSLYADGDDLLLWIGLNFDCFCLEGECFEHGFGIVFRFHNAYLDQLLCGEPFADVEATSVMASGPCAVDNPLGGIWCDDLSAAICKISSVP